MDKDEGKQILDILRSMQAETEQLRVHNIELQNRIMILSGAVDHVSTNNR